MQVPKNMLCWIQGAAILRHRTSDVNRLRHWRLHVPTSYGCPVVSEQTVIHPSWAYSSHSALTRMGSKRKNRYRTKRRDVRDRARSVPVWFHRGGGVSQLLCDSSDGI